LAIATFEDKLLVSGRLPGYTYRLYAGTAPDFNWQEVPLGYQNVDIYDIAVDEGDIYLATNGGVAVSSDGGKTFVWSLVWSWDSVVDIDAHAGVVWGAIQNWGSFYGPIVLIPGASWNLVWGDISSVNREIIRVCADPQDPANVAYICSGYGGSCTWFLTVNGGSHWEFLQSFTPLSGQVLVIDGKSVFAIPSQQSYSDDRGMTWKKLRQSGSLIISNPSLTGTAFLGGKGVYVGKLGGPWSNLGLTTQAIRYLLTCGSKLVACDDTGMYAANLADIVPNP